MKNSLLFLFFLFALSISFNINHSIEKVYLGLSKNDKNFIDFVSKTPESSVFAANYKNKLIDIIGRRALFSGNGFVFSEDCFEEYQKKRELIYGTRKRFLELKNNYNLFNINSLIETKTPYEFIEISKSYRLDYIILKNENKNFKGIDYVFKNNEITIYSIDSLRSSINPISD